MTGRALSLVYMKKIMSSNNIYIEREIRATSQRKYKERKVFLYVTIFVWFLKRRFKKYLQKLAKRRCHVLRTVSKKVLRSHLETRVQSRGGYS